MDGETRTPVLTGGPADRPRAKPRAGRQLRLLRWGSIIGPALLLAFFAWAAWDRLLDNAREESLRRSELVGEYIRRTIDGQATLLAAAERAHDLLALSPDREFALHRFLAGLTADSGGSSGIGLVAPDGRLVVSSTVFPVDGGYGDRAYLHNAPKDGLYIDRVQLRPSGDEALIVARRDQGAPSAGVWVARLDVREIEDFMRALAPVDEGDSASVWRSDGFVLLRNLPMPEPLWLAPDSVAMRAVSDGRNPADYDTLSYADGVRRIYSTRRLGGQALYASFGVATTRLRTIWLRQVAIAGALLGACGVVAYGLARQADRAFDREAARAAHEFDRKLLAEAQKTASARETMLRELNHRINNNLQMIQSLIRLQKSREAGPDLDEIAARILAIARIHDLLYQSGGAFSVDLGALLGSVAANPALVPPERAIEVDCDLEAIEADARVATPLALCVTEMITNAVKHAFDPEGGVIRVTLRRFEGSTDALIDGAPLAEVIVEDDGRGLDAAKTRRSGTRLIEALAIQIGGRLETGPAQPGADRPGMSSRIVFPLQRPEGPAET